MSGHQKSTSSGNKTTATQINATIDHIVRALRWFTAHRMGNLEAAVVHAEDFMAFLNQHIDSNYIVGKGDWVSIFKLTETPCIEWDGLTSMQRSFIPNPCMWLAEYDCLRRAIRNAIPIVKEKKKHHQYVLTIIRDSTRQWIDTLEPLNENYDDDTEDDSD